MNPIEKLIIGQILIIIESGQRQQRKTDHDFGALELNKKQRIEHDMRITRGGGIGGGGGGGGGTGENWEIEILPHSQ